MKSVAEIMESVLPLVEQPDPSFLKAIENSIVELIYGVEMSTQVSLFSLVCVNDNMKIILLVLRQSNSWCGK